MPRPRHADHESTATPQGPHATPKAVPIFLDFEGVLRPAMSKGPFECAKLLVEPLLAARAAGLEPKIVISSTYRLDYAWRELASILESHAPGLGQFVSGANPDGKAESAGLPDESEFHRAPRLFESLLWIEQRAPSCGSDWIAIDDTARLYGGEGRLPPQLILCDPASGFCAADADALSEKLALIARRPRPHASTPR